jgi:hypothetical protein
MRRLRFIWQFSLLFIFDSTSVHISNHAFKASAEWGRVQRPRDSESVKFYR